MPRVRFNRDTDERREGAAFRAGDEADLPQASVDRWLRRGAVEVIPGAPVVAKPWSPPTPLQPSPTAMVEIPPAWRELPWAQMRSLAAKVATAPVRTQADAVAAIEAEIARRAPTLKVGDTVEMATALHTGPAKIVGEHVAGGEQQ